MATIDSIINQIISMQALIQANAQSFATSKDLVATAQASLDAGTTTMDALLDAYSQQKQAKQALSQSQYDQLMLIIQLHIATGTLDDTRIQALSQLLSQPFTIPNALP